MWKNCQNPKEVWRCTDTFSLSALCHLAFMPAHFVSADKGFGVSCGPALCHRVCQTHLSGLLSPLCLSWPVNGWDRECRVCGCGEEREERELGEYRNAGPHRRASQGITVKPVQPSSHSAIQPLLSPEKRKVFSSATLPSVFPWSKHKEWPPLCAQANEVQKVVFAIFVE